MIIRSLIIILISLGFLSCKRDEISLPEKSANGMLTINGTDYSVNYAMIKTYGPLGGGLYDHWLAISDYPIGWKNNNQFFTSRECSFSLIIRLMSFDDKILADEYNFWNPDIHLGPWWNISHLYIKNQSPSMPNNGKVVLSELDGVYSILIHVNGNYDDENLSEINGIVYGDFN